MLSLRMPHVVHWLSVSSRTPHREGWCLQLWQQLATAQRLPAVPQLVANSLVHMHFSAVGQLPDCSMRKC
jgi:hypothetical protein